MASNRFEPKFDDLVPGGYKTNSPPEIVAELRSGVESMPETKATFKISEVLSEGKQAVTARMVFLVGAWVMPPFYPGHPDTDGNNRYVNPGYVHAHKYPDVAVECKCGAPMVRQKRDGIGDMLVEGEHEHTDDCKRSWRLRARARLMEKREQVVREIVKHDMSARAMAERFGLNPDHGYENSIGSITEGQNIDSERLREVARLKRINTECACLAAGVATEDVGALWGVQASTIRQRVAEYTSTSISDLRSGATA